MRLAKELGEYDVDGMLDNLTPEQFDEWIAYANLEPFDNGWTQAAIISCTVYNMIITALHAYAGKRPKQADLLDIDDFMPKTPETKKRKKRMNTREVAAMLKQQVAQWQ